MIVTDVVTSTVSVANINGIQNATGANALPSRLHCLIAGEQTSSLLKSELDM